MNVRDPEADAATLGDPVAQCNVAIRCLHAQDYDQAAVWLQRSAASGCGEAQYHLARCFLTGTGVAQDLLQAAGWCLKAKRIAGSKELMDGIVLRAALDGNLACLKHLQKHAYRSYGAAVVSRDKAFKLRGRSYARVRNTKQQPGRYTTGHMPPVH